MGLYQGGFELYTVGMIGEPFVMLFGYYILVRQGQSHHKFLKVKDGSEPYGQIFLKGLNSSRHIDILRNNTTLFKFKNMFREKLLSFSVKSQITELNKYIV